MKKLEQYLLFFFCWHVWEIRNTNRIVSLWLVQIFFSEKQLWPKKLHNYEWILLQTTFLLFHSGPENLKKSSPKNPWNQINQIFFSWNCISCQFKKISQFKNWFLAICEIAKNGILSKENFMKLIYLISRVF